MEKRKKEPGGEDELEPNYFKVSDQKIDERDHYTLFKLQLNEKCDRLASHKTMTRCLYACSFEMFVDVVDSFSEKLLIDEHFIVTRICSKYLFSVNYRMGFELNRS